MRTWQMYLDGGMLFSILKWRKPDMHIIARVAAAIKYIADHSGIIVIFWQNINVRWISSDTCS